MANDDWRITVEVDGAEEIVGRLADLGAEAQKLAADLKRRRLAVSRDNETIFVYAGTRADAEKARAVVEAELHAHGLGAKTSNVEHWLDDEERWDDEPKTKTWEQEEVDEGYAPWEVRVECGSHHEAKALADRLEQEGYKPVRRFRYLIVGTATKDDAEALAARLHGEVELGGEVVWEEMPQDPFAVFGGLGQ
jgi:hypothetical protein